mgnify:FL=1
MNRLKAEHGLVPADVADATEKRIARAVELIAEIDRIVALPDANERRARLRAVKPQVDGANLSTVCDKRELELPVPLRSLNFLRAAQVVAEDWLRARRNAAQET